MNIKDFLERISEMGPIAVFFVTEDISGNAGGGYPRNACNIKEYEETLEVHFEDDSYGFGLKKANIQSIYEKSNCLFVEMKSGNSICFECD